MTAIQSSAAVAGVPPEPRPGGALAAVLAVVIEDDGMVRAAVCAYLEELGCEVLAAASAEAALALCRSLPRHPRLMICDYGLPGGANGLQVIASTRRHLGCDVAAYLMTGMACPDVLRSSREIGVPVIHKPVSPSQLQSIVERARG